MKKLFSARIVATLAIYAAVCTALYSQQQDSITLVNTDWRVEQITEGVLLKQFHYTENTLFSSNQFISIIEISPSAKLEYDIIASPLLEECSSLAKKNSAIVAINGSFFSFNYEYNTTNYNSVDYIRKEGKVLAPNTYTSPQRAMHQRGAIAINSNQLYILLADDLKEWENLISASQVITTGPPLRIAGRDLPLESSSFYTTRHPRSAIAKRKDGTVLFFVVDGRSTQSAGMSLEELQKSLRWLGAEYLINLDGGGSSTLYTQRGGVVNHPSDNKVFDNQGERRVANIIAVKRREE